MSRWETHPGRMCTISGQKEGKIGAEGGQDRGKRWRKCGPDPGYRGKRRARSGLSGQEVGRLRARSGLCGLSGQHVGIIWAIGAECGQNVGNIWAIGAECGLAHIGPTVFRGCKSIWGPCGLSRSGPDSRLVCPEHAEFGPRSFC